MRRFAQPERMTMTTAVDFHDAIATKWNDKYNLPSFRRRAELLMALVDRSTLHAATWMDAGCGPVIYPENWLNEDIRCWVLMPLLT